MFLFYLELYNDVQGAFYIFFLNSCNHSSLPSFLKDFVFLKVKTIVTLFLWVELVRYNAIKSF